MRPPCPDGTRGRAQRTPPRRRHSPVVVRYRNRDVPKSVRIYLDSWRRNRAPAESFSSSWVVWLYSHPDYCPGVTQSNIALKPQDLANGPELP
jgi:hypothetical protein